jgi:hypothetical protein
MDTDKFTEQMNKYAPQVSLFLCRKVRLFMRAFLGDICGIQDKEDSDDWSTRDRTENGWYWGRVEFTETRGIQHWHYLVKLPNVLDTALLGRIVNNGRVVRQELKCGNIKEGSKEDAWELIEMGLVASKYCTLFADSMSLASFYHDGDHSKIIDVEDILEKFQSSYNQGKVTRHTHPLMRRYGDPGCDKDDNVEMANVAAVSCIHKCLPGHCGGAEKESAGKRSTCRFDFPKKALKYTVPAIMEVNADLMEARVLIKRTCTRVPNLNRYMLRYWRSNHDASVLCDAGHKMRFLL